jgi:pilus assembly protein CpaE
LERIRVAVAAQDRAVRTALSSALQHKEIDLVDTMSPSNAAVNRIVSQPIDAAVLFNDGTDAVFELAEHLYIGKSVSAVVIVCPEMTASVLQRVVDCGASKAVDYKTIEAELAESVIKAVRREKSRALAPSETGSYQSRVISVFGTKGGSGKTMVAVNVACQLAMRKMRVALVDLDMQFGDVGVFLDIARSDSIADVIQENAFEYKALKSYLYSHPNGLFVLCAPQSPEMAETVLGEHVTSIITSLRANFDFVVLDMPPAFNDTSIAGLEVSDEIYFCMTPDLSALRNAKVSIGVLDSLSLGDRVFTVLNKNGGSMIKAADIEKVLNRKTSLVIPNDYQRSVKSINRGIPLVIGDKNSPAAKSIAAFVQKTVLAGTKADSLRDRKQKR